MPTPVTSVSDFLRLLFPGFVIATGIFAYLAVFWGVPPSGSVVSTLYVFLGVFVGFMIDAWDPLLHGRMQWIPEVDFFRKQFPSKYIRSKVLESGESLQASSEEDPVESQTSSITSVWFYVFDNLFSDYLRNYVLGVSSACRAVLYTKYFTAVLTVISLLTLVVQWRAGNVIPGESAFTHGLWLIAAGGLICAFTGGCHRVGTEPTGVWRKWQRISEDQIFWMKANWSKVEELLRVDEAGEAPPDERQ